MFTLRPISLFKLIGTFGAGYFVCSKFTCSSKISKLKKKHLHDQKELYSQYYNDVYKLQEYIAALETALKASEAQREQDLLQRDMEEFKQPDTDGDGLISRAEFNHYVRTYLANYPGLTEKDFPKWEDFDHDKNGYITFQEYRQQMALLAQQEELSNYYKQQAGQKTNREVEKGLHGLYKESAQVDNFNDLYAQLRKRV
jgi:Ca2+-binding EF-hand superfamily protein